MEKSVLNSKISDAIRATKEFIEFLNTINLTKWEATLLEILGYLEAGNYEDAIKLQKQTSYGGPGSRSDVFLENEKQKIFYTLEGAQSASIGYIRVYVEYGINRKSVYAKNP